MGTGVKADKPGGGGAVGVKPQEFPPRSLRAGGEVGYRGHRKPCGGIPRSACSEGRPRGKAKPTEVIVKGEREGWRSRRCGEMF